MKTESEQHGPNPNVYDKKIGKTFWFEYHLHDNGKMYDPELWFRTHQQVTVIDIVDPGKGKTMAERNENRSPRFYQVRFEDGFEHKVSEGELLQSKTDLSKESDLESD